MIDLTTLKELIVGGINLVELYINGILVWKSGYTNWVPLSINANGTIFNNGLGYKNGYRVRSGGGEAASENGTITGFIPVKGGDTIGIGGILLGRDSNTNAINVSDSTFTNIGQAVENYANAGYGIFAPGAAFQTYSWSSGIEKNGCFYWTVPYDAGISYVRVTGRTGGDGTKLVVTINEEIT